MTYIKFSVIQQSYYTLEQIIFILPAFQFFSVMVACVLSVGALFQPENV
jgi:hypothetical protein